MVISDFRQLMREHMDYYDMPTVNMLAEATDNNQNQILIALTSKLYEMIVAKVTKIDYSSVACSRGDITKIENYAQLVETINIIKNIVAEYRCDTAPVDVVERAIDNVQARSNVFKKAFVIGAPIPIVLYNNICINIVASVSYMVDTCIEYIKNPQSQSFQMALDVVAYNKTKDCLMFETLKTFNEGCNSGDVDEAIKVSLNKTRVKREAAELPMNEGYGFNNPDNFTLRLIHSCIKAIRKGREKGISNEGIERQVTNIIDKRLNSTDLNASMAYVMSYGVAQSNLAHSAAMLRALQNISLSTVKSMERDYNATHVRKRTYADSYKSQDIDLIKKCAKEVRKQKVSVNKEAFEKDPEAMADLKQFQQECQEDMACAISFANPFMTDEDIDNPRTVLHDDETVPNNSPLEEGFDGIASVVARGLIALCKLVVPLIRHIVYLYFFSRQRVSDYFESQAIAIEMNAYQLQYNQDMDPDRRQEIYNKQMKVAEKLRKKAMRTSIDYKKSKKDADNAIAQEQKKFTSNDLEFNPNDETLDSSVSSSILF